MAYQPVCLHRLSYHILYQKRRHRVASLLVDGRVSLNKYSPTSQCSLCLEPVFAFPLLLLRRGGKPNLSIRPQRLSFPVNGVLPVCFRPLAVLLSAVSPRRSRLRLRKNAPQSARHSKEISTVSNDRLAVDPCREGALGHTCPWLTISCRRLHPIAQNYQWLVLVVPVSGTRATTTWYGVYQSLVRWSCDILGEVVNAAIAVEMQVFGVAVLMK